MHSFLYFPSFMVTHAYNVTKAKNLISSLPSFFRAVCIIVRFPQSLSNVCTSIMLYNFNSVPLFLVANVRPIIPRRSVEVTSANLT